MFRQRNNYIPSTGSHDYNHCKLLQNTPIRRITSTQNTPCSFHCTVTYRHANTHKYRHIHKVSLKAYKPKDNPPPPPKKNKHVIHQFTAADADHVLTWYYVPFIKKGSLLIFVPSLIVFSHRTWHWIGRFPGLHNGGIMSWHWNMTLFQRQLVEISNMWRSKKTNFSGKRKDLDAIFVLYERRIGIRHSV